jgi:hypothetical protein
MGPSSDQIEREIGQVRGSMESKIVELRERSERQVRRATGTAAIVAGAGAVLGVAFVGAFVVYRLTRPASARERVRRLAPSGLRRPRLRLRDRVPAMRLSVGDRQVGEEAPVTRWEKIAVRAAQAAGTAAAGAIATRLVAGIGQALRDREGRGGAERP